MNEVKRIHSISQLAVKSNRPKKYLYRVNFVVLPVLLSIRAM